jgi:hypothetical protein
VPACGRCSLGLGDVDDEEVPLAELVVLDTDDVTGVDEAVATGEVLGDGDEAAPEEQATRLAVANKAPSNSFIGPFLAC